jgi:hypothetical protein
MTDEEQELIEFRRDAAARIKKQQDRSDQLGDQHNVLMARRDALPIGDAGEAKLSQSINRREAHRSNTKMFS